MARSPAPSTCPLGPRLMIQPLLDPATRMNGTRVGGGATCPVLLTLTATRLIDVTADGQRTNQPSGLTGRLVNTSLRLFLDRTPFLRHIAQPAARVRRALPRKPTPAREYAAAHSGRQCRRAGTIQTQKTDSNPSFGPAVSASTRLTAGNGRRPVWEPRTATSCPLNT